jgi:HEAT repeat protein/tRNA A-37 threonylcarbamoyl transferase component Bud32
MHAPSLATGTTLPGVGHAHAHDANDPMVGRELNSYRLLQRIGQGGMGMVYLGQHAMIGRKAAVKVLKAELCQDQEVVERFYQEARAVGQLAHENIIDVYDFGRTDEGQVFFVMELLEGNTLGERLKKGPLSFQEAQPLLLQLAEALSAAHEKGITHRDIKPENIFLVPRSSGPAKVKVLDFGLAKLAAPGSVKERLTQAGTILGTPHYMSPEQIDGGRIDTRSDIYSFGAVMYEMFAGRPPFEGDTVGALLKGHLFIPPPPLQANPALRVPALVAKIVARALQKKAENRYSRFSDLIADLRDAASDTALVGAPGSRVSSGSRAPLVWIGGAVVAAAAAVAVLSWAPWREEAPAPPPAPVVASAPTLDQAALQAKALNALRDGLSASNKAQQARSAEALGALRDTASAANVRALLRQNDPVLVQSAALALGELGDTASKAELNTARSAFPESSPARTAIDQALSQLGDEEATQRLLARLDAQEESERLAAALFLAARGESKAEPALLALVASSDPAIKKRAPDVLRALLGIGNDEAQKRLEDLLANESPEARLSAAEVLAEAGDSRGQESAAEIFSTGAPAYKLLAARTLVLLGDYSGYRTFVEALSNSKAETREAGLAGLALLGDTKALPEVAPVFEKDSEPLVRLAAARTIVEIVGLSPELLAESSADWLSGALASQDANQRAAAARALPAIAAEDAPAKLALLAKDESPDVRKATADALGGLIQGGNAQAVDAARGLLTDKNAEVATAAVSALALSKDEKLTKEALGTAESGPGALAAAGVLAARGDQEAKETIRKASRSSDAKERALAFAAADQAGDVETLKKGLKDKSPAARLAAAKGLAARGDKDALAVLDTLSKDQDAGTATEAQGALASLGAVPAEQEDAPWPSNASIEVKRKYIEQSRKMPIRQAFRRLLRGIHDTDAAAQSESVSAVASLEAKDPESAKKLYRSAISAARLPEIRKQAKAALARLLLRGPAAEVATPAPSTAPQETPQEDPSIDESEKEKDYGMLISTAGVYVDRGKYKEGIDRYKRAQEIKNESRIDFELGNAYRRWGDTTFGDDKARLSRYKSAKAAYQRYQSRGGQQAAKVSSYVAELDRQIKKLSGQ